MTIMIVYIDLLSPHFIIIHFSEIGKMAESKVTTEVYTLSHRFSLKIRKDEVKTTYFIKDEEKKKSCMFSEEEFISLMKKNANDGLYAICHCDAVHVFQNRHI